MGSTQSKTQPSEERSSAPSNYEFNWEAEKLKLEAAIADTDELLTQLSRSTPGVAFLVNSFRKDVMEPMIAFLNEVFTEARPPVIFMLGRCGHGKSSLINSLANTDHAKVGHVAPTTSHAEVYDIVFKGQTASWKVIDSRGYFETTRPDGALLDAAQQIQHDLKQYKPDIILRLIASAEVRNCKNDLEFLKDAFKRIKALQSEIPPVITVLTKADQLSQQTRWPIEDHVDKQRVLQDLLVYTSKDVLKASSWKPLDRTTSYYGNTTEGCEANLYVIPVVSINEDIITQWNIDRLTLLIGEELPQQAWVHFYKGRQHADAMKGLTTKIIKKFAKFSVPIGALPGPGVSLILLAPLQLLLIRVIGKLAGSSLSFDTVTGFLRASCGRWGALSLTTGGCLTALAAAEFLETVSAGISAVVSGPVAAAATYSIGKTAEAFFFDGKVCKPEEFVREWEESVKTADS